MTSPRRRSSRVIWDWLRRIGLFAVTVLVVEYFALPQIVDGGSDLSLLSDAAPVLLSLAFVLEAASLAMYTVLTQTVIPRTGRLRFFDQLRIDLTGFGVSHIVPGGGASAAALRYGLMTERGVPPADAASTAVVQVAVASIGLTATFAGGVVLSGPGIVANPGYAAAGTLATMAILVVLFGLVRLPGEAGASDRRASPRRALSPYRPLGARTPARWERGVSGLRTSARTTVRQAGELLRDTHRRLTVLGWAATNWLLDAGALWVCLWAYDLRLSPGVLLTAYGAANLLALLPITPGGLGIVEGALIPGLAALSGAAAAPIVLGTLTWRLFQFWLPIPVAGLTFVSLRFGHRPAAPRRVPPAMRSRPGAPSSTPTAPERGDTHGPQL